MLVIEIASGIVIGYLAIRFWRVCLATLGVIAAIIAVIVGVLVYNAQIAPHLTPQDLELTKWIIYAFGGMCAAIGVLNIVFDLMERWRKKHPPQWYKELMEIPNVPDDHDELHCRCPQCCDYRDYWRKQPLSPIGRAIERGSWIG